MKKKIVSLVVVVALIAPITANAGFLSNLVSQFGYRLSISANETLSLYKAMADDMNLMADRIMDMAGEIGVMADRILDMADQIGVMADRIVATETLMANLTTDMATIAADVATINTNTSTNTVEGVFISNSTQPDLYAGDVPNFTMSQSTPEYLVFVSSTLTMDTNTISVLVHNQAELEALWPNLVGLTQDQKIYIGVKSITNNQISSLSNILTYNVL